jgi:putative transposase
LVDDEYYFLTVSRYIELNPVRAGMVEHPAEYPWSSYHANGLGKDIQLMTSHRVYERLGEDKEARQENYRGLFNDIIPERTLEVIRNATNKAWVLGETKFKQEIEQVANRNIESLGWGGDRKSAIYQKRLSELDKIKSSGP